MIAGWLRSRAMISIFSLLMSAPCVPSWNGPEVPLARSSSITWRVGVAARERVHAHAVVLVVLLDAGERAAVVGELARLGGRVGGEVAPQQVGAALVDAHVELARGLRVEAAHAGVAVDRVELVGLDVAEEALLRVLVGIVGRGEQVFALDLALEVEGGARAGVRLAVVPLARQLAQLLLEAVGGARGHERARADVAHVDDALDHAGGDEVAQLGQEVEACERALRAAHDDNLGRAGHERGQQRELARGRLR